MIQGPLFAYAGARILARHGRRPGPDDWERLRSIGDFGHYLQTARETGLEPFVRHLGSGATGHEVERALLSAWRAHIREVAGWQPEPWRPAIRWLAVVSELPALGHILAGHPAPSWITDLPVAGRAIGSGGTDPGRTLARVSAVGPLLTADPMDGETLRQRALGHWRRLLPVRPRRFRRPLEDLEGAVETYLKEIADGTDGADQRLERALLRSLRRHSQEPVAAYAYLGLVALDLQRLRGALLLRRLLPGQAA